jgi:hypothetical protein
MAGWRRQDGWVEKVRWLGGRGRMGGWRRQDGWVERQDV